ncbi:hypothetical protein Tco_0809365, partial [Tanacetum coccineum]
TDEQIVPRSQWLTIGKSNLLFNGTEKIQKNPIFQISVDILSNTNFFQAFTASANVPAIYLQQFWENSMSLNERLGFIVGQVDEQWFDLRKTSGNSDKSQTPQFCKLLWGMTLKQNVFMRAVWEELSWDPGTFFSHICIATKAFVPKGESLEVFGMAIPDPLITEAIQQSSYYSIYLKMVAENTKKTPQGSESISSSDKETFQAQQESIPQEEGNDPDLELAKKLRLETHQEKGEGEGDDADLERAIKLSLDQPYCLKSLALLEE